MTVPTAPIDRSGCSARYHGTPSAYQNARCRCPDAREAQRLYAKRLREGRQPAGRVSPLGTQRRLRALAAIGWRTEDLAERLGMPRRNVHLLRTKPRTPTINRTTAERVARLYEQLSGRPGPSELTRKRARARGWAPPMAWDDERLDDPPARARGVRPVTTLRPDPERQLSGAALVARAQQLYIRLQEAEPYIGKVTWARVADELGVSVKALEKARERAAKREDVA